MWNSCGIDGQHRHAGLRRCGTRSKPYPDPLLHAARDAGYDAARCVYVGDDLRDVQAAHAAGMPAVAAGYGYLGGDHDITLWEADARADTPDALWEAIESVLPAQGRRASAPGRGGA